MRWIITVTKLLNYLILWSKFISEFLPHEVVEFIVWSVKNISDINNGGSFWDIVVNVVIFSISFKNKNLTAFCTNSWFAFFNFVPQKIVSRVTIPS